MKYMFLAALLLLMGPADPAGAEHDIPFQLPVPEGWNTETIPFPLGFAPQIKYEGLEELRFAPGWLKAGEEDFWTYAFVWWIPRDSEITAENLQEDLDAYYHGLNHDKPAKEDGTKEIPPVRSVVRRVEIEEGEPARFEGTIDTFDSFVTREPITLNFTAEVITCADQEMIAVYFELSPQPTTHIVWEKLREIRQGFACEK